MICYNITSKTCPPNQLYITNYSYYFQNLQYHSSSSSSEFSNELSNLANGPDPLPTVHEDKELIMNPPVHINYLPGKIVLC